MKRTFRRLLAICLVMMLAFAMSAPAFAITGAPVKLTKRVLVPVGMVPPATTYQFLVEPKDVDNSTTPLSPTLNYNNSGDNYVTITYDGSEAKGSNTINGYNYYDLEIADLFKDTTFPHAGVFNYEVTEIDSGATFPDGTLTYSQAVYEIKVNVKNDGSGGLEVDSAAIRQTTDDAGDPNNSGTKTDLLFVNTYDSATTFTVSKEVAGNFADLTKEFTYTINFAGTSDPTIDALYTKADGSTSSITIDTITGVFTLKTGESLTFNSLTTAITYDLTESAAPGYAATVVVNGTETESGATGDAVVIGKGAPGNPVLANPIAIVSGTNTAEWTNTFNDNVDTGVIMNVLPFIILIVVAVGGFAGYLAMRRRKLNHR